jgi:hypothetical protein
LNVLWHPSYTTTRFESEVQGMFSGDLVDKKKYKKNLVCVKKIYNLVNVETCLAIVLHHTTFVLHMPHNIFFPSSSRKFFHKNLTFDSW